MADERANSGRNGLSTPTTSYTYLPVPTTSSDEHDKSTTTPPPFTHHPGYPAEIADMEKAQIDQSDLYPSQEVTYENYLETLEPPKLHWWRTIPLGLAFIAVAIASQVVLVYSRYRSGFVVHLTDFELTRGKQFAKSFGPSILFVPLFLWFSTSYDTLKLLKPYIDKDVDKYGKKGPVSAGLLSLKQHRWVVFALSCILLGSGIFHSLAGAYFQVISAPRQWDTTVNITGKVALGYDKLVNQYIPFVDAAGFVDTVSQIGVLYSPFTFNDTNGNFWVVPSFTLADSNAIDQGGNVSVAMRGLLVQAHCTPVPSPVISGPYDDNRYNISGTLSNNCSATSYAISDGTTWYSWVVPAPFECLRSIDPSNNHMGPSDPFFSPVAFSFFKNKSSASMIFCSSMIEEHDVIVGLSVDGLPNIYDVSDHGNVSFLSWGPNGIGWQNPNQDPRVEGIKVAVGWTLADTIARLAGLSDMVGGEINASQQDTILSNGTSVAQCAEAALIWFQAVVAPYTFVVGPSFQANAIQSVLEFRLVAINAVAHTLTAMCTIVGLILIVLYIHHHVWREKLLASVTPSVPAPAS
ncbi:uncharacterized protein EI90DRAFT_3115027 [Cantharellus anzutake]|uniref:uncharacterized protein n=1 Tax=Cantharellus anzutake TaxID=1750568 RepID=UPI0019067E83|nr:uncharacterized protein EI90DRAFT_3115027 [Cantharellus anzutake]KAF8344277.1 hypothetical protein EI90DRAFT_3115027 [Cantharellus anzutake]